jgi:hypothetical protein
VFSAGPHDTTVEEPFKDMFSIDPSRDILSGSLQLFKLACIENRDYGHGDPPH